MDHKDLKQLQDGPQKELVDVQRFHKLNKEKLKGLKGHAMHLQMSLIADYAERVLQLENFQKMNSLVAAKGYIATEVPADGNCALWSILQLEEGKPLGGTSSQESCQKLRERIAKRWELASKNTSWQKVFKATVAVFQAAEDEDGKSKAAASVVPTAKSKSPKSKATRPNKEVDAAANVKIKKERSAFEANMEEIDVTTPQKKLKLTRPAFCPWPQKPKAVVEQTDGGDGSSDRQQLRSKVEAAVSKAEEDGRKVQMVSKTDEDEKEEVEDEMLVAEQKQGKRRRSRCFKKKEPTQDARMWQAVRLYLANKGVTWQMCQKSHANLKPVDGSAECLGFAHLQAKLIDGSWPDCGLCQSMMKKHNCNPDDVEKLCRWAESLHEPVSLLMNTFGVEEDLESFLQMLPVNTHDKRVPIRCLLCKSKRQPEGKIFEGHSLQPKTLRNFKDQHIRGACHVAAFAAHQARLKRFEAPEQEQEDEREEIEGLPCIGISLTGNDRYATSLKEELLAWAKSTTLISIDGKKNYSYTINVKTNDLIVHATTCYKVCPPDSTGQPTACKMCSANPYSIGRSAITCCLRFTLKCQAVAILEARLLKPEGEADKIIEEFKKTPAYTATRLKSDKVIGMDLTSLQNFVRNSWMRTPPARLTEEHPGLKIS